ncbi:MAG: 2OG-Fe(II) oxygenase [Gammaproteobacteria bacterium]
MTASPSPIFDNESLTEGLRKRGWWAQRHYFDCDLIEQLAAELHTFRNNGGLHAAGIGRGRERQLVTSIRNDTIRWLDGATLPQRRYLERMEALRQDINRELFLGLFEFEAHYAYYQPGAYYQKHLDSFRGAANRVVSAVTYLNRDWPADCGGELLIFNPGDDSEICRIQPDAGTLVVFLSEEIPHAVVPATRKRASIAGWFRVNSSSHSCLNPPA